MFSDRIFFILLVGFLIKLSLYANGCHRTVLVWYIAEMMRISLQPISSVEIGRRSSLVSRAEDFWDVWVHGQGALMHALRGEMRG